MLGDGEDEVLPVAEVVVQLALAGVGPAQHASTLVAATPLASINSAAAVTMRCRVALPRAVDAAVFATAGQYPGGGLVSCPVEGSRN